MRFRLLAGASVKPFCRPQRPRGAASPITPLLKFGGATQERRWDSPPDGEDARHGKDGAV